MVYMGWGDVEQLFQVHFAEGGGCNKTNKETEAISGYVPW